MKSDREPAAYVALEHCYRQMNIATATISIVINRCSSECARAMFSARYGKNDHAHMI
jgi:hypothetical protein